MWMQFRFFDGFLNSILQLKLKTVKNLKQEAVRVSAYANYILLRLIF